MVKTIYINNDGEIEFENGSLKLVGISNKLDKDEKLQSLRLRFLTQLGENKWASDEGFDYSGILSQIPTELDVVRINKEKVIEVNCVKTLAQDKDISKYIDFIRVELIDKNDAIAHITCHTVNGIELKGDFKLGEAVIG